MNVGKRVRFAHTNSFGVVTGPTKNTGINGGPRTPVLWENSKQITSWHPNFLMDENSLEINDPDVVYGDNIKKSRPKITTGKDGMIVIEEGGFSKHE